VKASMEKRVKWQKMKLKDHLKILKKL
jgi:hypothetical protein